MPVAARVKFNLLWNRETSAIDIDSVSSQIKKDYVVKLVKNTVNVKKVVDRLSVDQ